MSNLQQNLIKRYFWQSWYRLRFFTDLAGITRLLKYRKIRSQYYREFWTGVANQFGATIKHDYFGYTRIIKNNRMTFVDNYNVMLEDHLMLKVMGDKSLTYSLLETMQYPLVKYKTFSMQSLNVAIEFLKNEKLVVVKPSSGTGGGRAVTTGIKNERQLRVAARLAARFGQKLIIEKQVAGNSLRLLFLDGQFIDAILREPPVICGNGVHTIKQLVATENKNRENGNPAIALSPLVIDKDARNWMKENNISLRDIPKKDQKIQIKLAVNENNCNSNINITSQIHPDIVVKCGELVKKLGAKFVGVDLICEDIGAEFNQKNCWVSEVNTTPGLHHHYLINNPADGQDVANQLLEFMWQNNEGVMDIGESNIDLAH